MTDRRGEYLRAFRALEQKIYADPELLVKLPDPKSLNKSGASTLFRALKKIGGVAFCKRCWGGGRFMWDGSTDTCYRCNGHGLETRQGVLPVEEIEQKAYADFPLVVKLAEGFFRLDAKERAKDKARYDALTEKRRLKQEADLAPFSDEEKTLFLKALAPTGKVYDEMLGDEHDVYVNDFVKDIAMKWSLYGCSEKQIRAVMASYQKHLARNEKLAQLKPITAGERYGATGKVTKIELVEGQFGYSTKVVIAGDSGRFFTIKTTAGKLLDVFREAKETGVKVQIEGVLKWVSDDGIVGSFTSRGFKVQLTTEKVS